MRRTKQAAEATRSLILDTAEVVFEARGVAGTSLNDIACAAGLTRGAIYWHFKDKADLFNAMMERVRLPLEATGDAAEAGPSAVLDMAGLRDSFVDVLRQVVTEPRVRRVFGIATHKVEYVAEMRAVQTRHIAIRNDCIAVVERTLAEAVERGAAVARIPTRAAAVGLHALLYGLLCDWMLEPAAFDLVQVGTEAIDAYLGHVAPAPADQCLTSPAKRSPRRCPPA